MNKQKRKWLVILSVGTAGMLVAQITDPAINQIHCDWLLMTFGAWVGWSVTTAILRRIHKGGA